jgi:hypothetical protein
LVAELRPQQRTEPLTEGVGFIEGQQARWVLQ